MKEFIEKHSKRICGVLSGLDRVRFRGTFRNLAVPVLLMKWLSHRNVLLKNFKSFVEGLTASLNGAAGLPSVPHGRRRATRCREALAAIAKGRRGSASSLRSLAGLAA